MWSFVRRVRLFHPHKPRSTFLLIPSLCCNSETNVSPHRQGACAPPVQPTANTQCFCTDTRLTSFSQSTSNIASVCGTASCSSEADLQALQTWYEGLCKDGGSTGATTTDGGNVATTTDSSGAAVTSTKAASSGNNGGRKNQGWYVVSLYNTAFQRKRKRKC